jgi:hypothetical protein
MSPAHAACESKHHLDAGLKVLICSITGFPRRKREARPDTTRGLRRVGRTRPLAPDRSPGATGKIRTVRFAPETAVKRT